MKPRPTLAYLAKLAAKAALNGVHVSIPARVESYNEKTMRVSAQPLIKRARKNEVGERQAKTIPVINEVPVVFPGAGGCRLKFPISRGDTVLLVFSEASLDKWLQKDRLVDPEDDRRHDLSDAIAIPGLQAAAKDASPMIEFTGDGEIHAGGDLALATKADIDALWSAFNGHNHQYQSGSGPTALTEQNPTAPEPEGTSVLKGK